MLRLQVRIIPDQYFVKIAHDCKGFPGRTEIDRPNRFRTVQGVMGTPDLDAIHFPSGDIETVLINLGCELKGWGR